MPKKVIIIGAGIGGIATSAILAKNGFDVTVIEKNSMPGGRAGVMNIGDFKFDSGPSWYMMPEAFDHFFGLFGKKVSQYYELTKMVPTYRAFFKEGSEDIFADYEKTLSLFESLEKGSSQEFLKILALAETIYKSSINDILYKDPSFSDFLNPNLIKLFLKEKLFQSYGNYINGKFSSQKIRNILSWHTVFLGGTPYNVPALYILMIYADFKLGTFFPKNGFYSVIQGLYDLAKEQGVKFIFDQPVTKIITEGNRAKSVLTQTEEYPADIVVSNADYNHTEEILLDSHSRSYSLEYWKKKVFSPSVFLYFAGMNKKFNQFQHHNYFFSEGAEDHYKSIALGKNWPKNPSFYISVRSKSDRNCAPVNGESLMFLVPIANGIEATDKDYQRTKNYLLRTTEEIIHDKIEENIVAEKMISLNEEKLFFNAYKGNAFGLANTLFQTGIFRPSNKSKKIINLYFTGSTTSPGIGVPLALISGEVTSNKILKDNVK